MPTFANLSQYVTTVTNKLTKPRRGVGGSEGVLASDVLSALVDCGTYVSEGLDSIVGKANRSGDTFTGSISVPVLGSGAAYAKGYQFQGFEYVMGYGTEGLAGTNVLGPVFSHVDYTPYSFRIGKHTGTALLANGSNFTPQFTVANSGVGHFGGRLHIGTGTDFTDQLTPLYVAGNGKFSNEIVVNTTHIGRGGGGIANNLRVGEYALGVNTTGNGNIAFGQYTLSANTTGNSNVGIGSAVLVNNTTGGHNVGIGSSALYNNVTGQFNVGIGTYALLTTTGSSYNTGIGYNTLGGLTTGGGNTALGFNAGYTITTGGSNVVLGNNSGSALTTGSNNVILGNFAGARIATLSNWMIFADGTGNERFCVDASGRMGIGTTTPDARAILDLTSTTQGLVIPRLTTTQRDAQTGWSNGTLIYNTTLNVFQGRANGAWVNL